MKINKVQNSTLFQSHASETRKFNVSCVVAIYSLHYSVMKSCSYWNSNTLCNVIQYGKRLYENLSSLNKYLPSDDLPKTVDVCGTEVSLDLKSDCSEGILSDSVDIISWIMFTVGSVDRYVDCYIGRRSGRHSVDNRSGLSR